MDARLLRIGMIGCGFMGRAHSNAYRQVASFFDPTIKPVLQVACARNRESIEAFARTWGYQHVETDWKKLIARPDIDAALFGRLLAVLAEYRRTHP